MKCPKTKVIKFRPNLDKIQKSIGIYYFPMFRYLLTRIYFCLKFCLCLLNQGWIQTKI